MDDEFFASVLKKWADASQQVVDLKRRLDEFGRERSETQVEITNAQDRDTEKLITQELLSPVSKHFPEKVLRLQEAGDRLEKARSEYQKLKEELHSANARQVSLEQEVESIKRERNQLQSQIQTSHAQYAECISELSRLRFEKETMTNRVFDLTIRLQQSEKAKAEMENQDVGTHNEEPQQVGRLHKRMSSLETQIQELQSFARNLESNNTSLRDELTVARDALQRTKESNKNLLATIASLSRIARNVVGISEAPQQHEPSSPQTAKNIFRESLSEASRITVKPTTKEEQKCENESLFNDDTIVAELNKPLISAPPRRLEALAPLPNIVIDDKINDGENKFTRGLTSAAIGNSIQSLIARTPHNGVEPAKGRNIEEYLCPRLDRNPWCPSTPGQHGFMFVGLGRERHTYTSPQLRHLFVGLAKRKHEEPRYFRYLGVYKVSRADPLSADEWQVLHASIKAGYVDATKDKNKDPRTKEEILAAYNSGELSVPCVQLQCVDFDKELYAGLLAFRAQYTVGQDRLSKRNRDDDHESSSAPPQRSKRYSKRLTQ